MKLPPVNVTLAPELQILKSEVEPLDSGVWSYLYLLSPVFLFHLPCVK